MIERTICEAVFREAVVACDPAVRVRDALEREPLPAGREIIGLAIGKAALAMARGAGPVTRGLVVAPALESQVRRIEPALVAADSHDENYARADAALSMPGQLWELAPVLEPEYLPPTLPMSIEPRLAAGWSVTHGNHPVVGEGSVAAGREAIEIIESATAGDVVLALISGGASALIEMPRDGMRRFDDFRDRVDAVMASGAPIQEINRVRTELSAIKGGKLAARSQAPAVTLVVSDVIGDDPRVIGSGPTVTTPLRDGDRVEVIAPMASFGIEIGEALASRGLDARRIEQPIADDVAVVADRLAAEQGAVVAWGEPTVRVPGGAGSGGRAQQLALELAKRLRGTTRSAFVAGSDGVDGPSRRGAAGAYVDGTTWDAIIAAKLDPDAALRRCDAGTVLDAVGALFVPGPTGINHADVVIVG